MHDVIELSGYSLLEVNGRDARAFLQAQTMNDVDALEDGGWQWNGLLNPKGRVIFLFRLLRLAEARYWLLQPVPRAEALATHLAGFRFRSKVGFEVLSNLAVHGGSGAAPVDPGLVLGPWSHRESTLGRIVVLAPSRSGWLLLGGSTDIQSAADAGGWLAEDLIAGLPRIGDHNAGAFTPQMLQLQRISAFSVRKGCYPGQEIVARTHFLGAAKRRMQLLRGAIELPSEVLLDAHGEVLGDVVDACMLGDECLLLCVLKSFAAQGQGIECSTGRLVAAEGW